MIMLVPANIIRAPSTAGLSLVQDNHMLHHQDPINKTCFSPEWIPVFFLRFFIETQNRKVDQKQPLDETPTGTMKLY